MCLCTLPANLEKNKSVNRILVMADLQIKNKLKKKKNNNQKNPKKQGPVLQIQHT